MFDFFRKHTRVLQFLLVLIIFPSFVLVGVNGYSHLREGAQATVADVDGEPITQAQWDAAHRIQVERTRAQMQGVDPAVFDTPQVRRESLDALIRERVVMTAANKLRLSTQDDRLQRLFRADPQLAFLRNPDGSVNKDALAAQGLSIQQFDAQLRAELTARQVFAGVTATAFAPAQDAAQSLDAYFQQREIQVQRFLASDYADKAAPTPAELEAYYNDPAHAADFQAPEQAQVDYVVLDLDAIAKTVTVSEDELRKYYTENQARYSAPEERRASHILIKADKGASDADKAKARARAEALLAQVRKDPTQFAEVAKKNSDDPGSAAKGGDLDFFPRGAMVKPFEDAAFALKPGDISDVVQSDFGFHVIRLTEQRGGAKTTAEFISGKELQKVMKEYGNPTMEAVFGKQTLNDLTKFASRIEYVTRKGGAAGELVSSNLAMNWWKHKAKLLTIYATSNVMARPGFMKYMVLGMDEPTSAAGRAANKMVNEALMDAARGMPFGVTPPFDKPTAQPGAKQKIEGFMK